MATNIDRPRALASLRPEWVAVGELIAIVDKVAKTAIWRLCPTRTGGYFCMADANSGQPLLIVQIGDPPADKAERYLTFCQEKARRLAQNPSHRSSWQSRDETKDQYGGAIRAKECIFSFSGFPELVDEAVMLVSALLGKRVLALAVDLHVVMEISGNKRNFAQLLEAVGD